MKTLKTLFRETYDPCDPWGSTMSWRFAVADYLQFQTGLETPTQWGYRPSPFGADSDSYEFQTIRELSPSEEELRAFGNLLERFDNRLRHKGLDY